MKFWIITPTYNRFGLLKRNIRSLQSQDYINYEHIIIDDSDNNETLKKIKKFSYDNRIKYYKNTKNKWVNYSRNIWIKHLSTDVDYVIFLDDDDYFNTYALSKAYEVIHNNNYQWYVSNKKWISKIPEYNKIYNYFEDYFLGQKIQWDTSHFIKKSSLEKIKFSPYIKQAEEWLFFIELWQKIDFFTYNYDTIISTYLPWWLTDKSVKNSPKILLRHFLALFEFIFIRNINIFFKIRLLKKLSK